MDSKYLFGANAAAAIRSQAQKTIKVPSKKTTTAEEKKLKQDIDTVKKKANAEAKPNTVNHIGLDLLRHPEKAFKTELMPAEYIIKDQAGAENTLKKIGDIEKENKNLEEYLKFYKTLGLDQNIKTTSERIKSNEKKLRWFEQAYADWDASVTLQAKKQERARYRKNRRSQEEINRDLENLRKDAYKKGALTSDEVRDLRIAEQGLRKELEWAKAFDYEDLSKRPDFAQKSKFKSTKHGELEYYDWGNVIADTGYDDALYDMINGDESAKQAYMQQTEQAKLSLLGFGNGYLENLSSDELSTYNYLHALDDEAHKKGIDQNKADEYLEFLADNDVLLEGDLKRRERVRLEKDTKSYAIRHPIMATAESIAVSPFKGLGYVGQAVDYLTTGKVDEDAGYNQYSHTQKAIRQTVSSNFGKAGSFLYQTGMSMADFILGTAISGGNSAVALTIMGTGAAADATIAAKEKGLSDDKAFAIGTIAGAAEILTEKISIDALLDKTTLNKSLFGYWLKNTVAEGSEEVASDFINLFSDVILSKEKSDWNQSIEKYKEKGMSKKDAFWTAFGDQMSEMGLDFMGGAISGGAFAAASIGINTLGNLNTRRKISDTFGENGRETFISIMPENIDYKTARAAIDFYNLGLKGGNINDIGTESFNALPEEVGNAMIKAGMKDRSIAKSGNAVYNDINAWNTVTDDVASGELDSEGAPIYARTRKEANIEGTDFSKLNKTRKQSDIDFGLERQESVALTGYINTTFARLNKALNAGIATEADLKKADSISSALKKFPTYDGRTYRNLRFESDSAYNDFLAKYAKGKKVALEAFTSTSKRPNGYPIFEGRVVHMVIDGQTGADIADTYGLPRQQEVIYLPGTEIEITNIATANDGNPIIYAQEVKTNDLGRNNENSRSAQSVDTNRQKDREGKTLDSGYGGRNREIHADSWDNTGGNGVLSERRPSDIGGRSLQRGRADRITANDTVQAGEAVRSKMFGQRGTEVFDGFTSEQRSNPEFVNAMALFYNAGNKGTSVNDISEQYRFVGTQEQREAMYKAGIADAKQKEISITEESLEQMPSNIMTGIAGNDITVNVMTESIHDTLYVLGQNGKNVISEIYENSAKNDGDERTDAAKSLYHTVVNDGDIKTEGSAEILTPEEQSRVVLAGLRDKSEWSKTPKEKGVFRNDAGFDSESEYARSVNRRTRRALDKIGKLLGVKIRIVGEIDGGISTGKYIDGVIEISKDSKNYLAAICSHEVTHDMQKKSPELYNRFRDYVAEIHSRSGTLASDIEIIKEMYKKSGKTLTTIESVDELCSIFSEKISGTVKEFRALARSNMSVAEAFKSAFDRFLSRIRYALSREDEINKMSVVEYGVEYDDLCESSRQWQNILNEMKKETKNTSAGADTNIETEISGARYRINPSFSRQIDSWDGKEKTVFNVGTTSEALKSIGVDDRKIILYSRKTAEILKKHSGMTIDIIKQLPEILENPIIVMKSRQIESRIVMFGEVRDINGVPVLAAIELEPQKGGGKLLNMNVVTSAYGKTSSVRNMVWGSELLYLDKNKKRTEKWLQSVGLQLPSDETKLGSMGTITYTDGKVNIYGVPCSKYMQKSKKILHVSEKAGARNAIAGLSDKLAENEERIQALNNMRDKYGTIPRGENAYREANIPRQTADNNRVSQTVRTILEAKATPDEVLPTIESLVAEGAFSNEVYTDKKAMRDAEEEITEKGYTRAFADWSNKSSGISKRNTAIGFALYNAAVNSGDVKTAIDVLDTMVRRQHNAAQAVQATRILKKMTPEGQLYSAVRSVQNIESELRKKYGAKAEEIKVNSELAERYLNSKDENARNEAMTEIWRDVGRQLPSTFRDKWNAWRYLAMLGNPRTHVRNIAGNAFFAPLVAAKDMIATGIESAVDALSKNGIDRQKAFVGFGTEDRTLFSTAFADFKNVESIALGEGKYSEGLSSNKAIEEERKIFKFKPLEAARKGNSKLLDVEDKLFSRPHYAYAMSQYCKANGISAEQIRSGKGLENARSYAIKEAQKATYRDTNAFSEFISGIGRFSEYDSEGNAKTAGKLGNLAVEGVLPFRKTPANILVRAAEYSPAQLIRVLASDISKVRQGKMGAAEMIDHISSGLVGTGILALGAFLASLGLVVGHGGGDDEERENAKRVGEQNYALLLPDGTSYTLDWLAPESIPFFIGVNIVEEIRTNNGDADMSSILSAISNATEPMIDMSCLQGLNDLLDNIGYAKSNGQSALTKILAATATSYFGQVVPTLLGQINRTMQDKRYTTFNDKNNKYMTSDMQYTLGKYASKIPGLGFNQVPYIDAWGNEQKTGNVAQRAFNNLINPGYVSESKETKVDKELLRLYRKTGETPFPSRAKSSLLINDAQVNLTAPEYVKYAKEKGQTSYRILDKMIKSDIYKESEDIDKVKLIEAVYDYANQEAKSNVSDFTPSKWVKKVMTTTAEYNIPEETYIMLYKKQSEIEGIKDKNGETIENSRGLLVMQLVYSVSNLSDRQRKALFEDFGVGKKIRHYNKALVNQKLKRYSKAA